MTVAFSRAAALACVFTLGACGLFGGDDDVRIRGERVRVLDAEETLTADVEAAGRLVRISEPVAAADWPQAFGGARNDPGHRTLPRDLSRAWSVGVGAGDGRKRRVVSAPIVADGRLFALDAKAQVTALDAKTGGELWSRRFVDESEPPISLGFGGGLAYDNGALFLASGFGFVARIDPDTGAEIWRRYVSAPIRSAPTVTDGQVYAVAIDNRLSVHDVETGDELWFHQGLEETARLLHGSSPAANEDIVIASYGSGEIFALSPLNGRVLWQDALSLSGRLAAIAALNDIAASPVLLENSVIAANRSGRLTSIDLRTGARIWTRSIGATQTPIHDGRFLYLVSVENELLCIDARDGLIVWLYRLNGEGDDAFTRWTGPVLAGGLLYVTSSEGDMIAADPQTGEPVASYEVGEEPVRAPVVAGDTLYILGDDADVKAYR